MRNALLLVTGLLVTCVLPGRATALTLGQVDTFQGPSADNWTAALLGAPHPSPPQAVASGGPGGTGDAFLQVTAVGGGGPGSRLVALNPAQWAGNYLSARISGISMDLRNLGNTDLTIRLLFEDPLGAPPLDEAVTSFGFPLPAGGGWTHAVFPVSPASLTVLQGNASALLLNTTVLRIIHAPAAGDAAPVIGQLGVDNIRAVPEPDPLALMAIGLGMAALLSWLRRRSR